MTYPIIIMALLCSTVCSAAYASDIPKTLDQKITTAITPSAPLKNNNALKDIHIKHGYNKTDDSSKHDQHSKSNSDGNSLVQSSNKIKGLTVKLDDKQHQYVNQLLDEALAALKAGQIEAAASIYEDVLSIDQENQDAMFGLATVHHRNGLSQEARKIYIKMLSEHPSNQAALNNFLALVSEEDPEGAIVELRKLEAVNPNMSIIPAQMGMIYGKQNKDLQAIKYLTKAVMLEPENTSYRYNLAVLYDRIKEYDKAVTIYRQLLEASYKGAILPDSPERIHNRITYISGLN
jgi:Tfp pilus assembly protein PilF